jgi:hypothetical protein
MDLHLALDLHFPDQKISKTLHQTYLNLNIQVVLTYAALPSGPSAQKGCMATCVHPQPAATPPSKVVWVAHVCIYLLVAQPEAPTKNLLPGSCCL